MDSLHSFDVTLARLPVQGWKGQLEEDFEECKKDERVTDELIAKSALSKFSGPQCLCKMFRAVSTQTHLTCFLHFSLKATLVSSTPAMLQVAPVDDRAVVLGRRPTLRPVTLSIFRVWNSLANTDFLHTYWPKLRQTKAEQFDLQKRQSVVGSCDP
jgi:hypothetical protein